MHAQIAILLCGVFVAASVSAEEPASSSEEYPRFPYSDVIDRSHVRLGERLNRTASWLDSRFSTPGLATGETASCSAVLGAEVGVEKGEGFMFRAKGKARFRLPRMKDRVRLTVDNVRRDMLPGVDPIESQRDLKLGIDWRLYRTLRSIFDLDVGVKLKPAPKPFVDLRLGYRRSLDGWDVAVRQSEFWNLDDHLAELTVLTFQRQLSEAWILRSTTAGKWGQKTVGLESEQTLAIAVQYGAGRSQVSLAGSVFAARDDISNCRLRLTWRSRVLRPWFSVYVVPELNFPAESAFAGKPGIRVGFETAYE